MGLGSPSPSASAAEQASECESSMSDPVDPIDEEELGPRDPFKDATAKQALIAIAMIFVIGLVIGFALGKTVGWPVSAPTRPTPPSSANASTA